MHYIVRFRPSTNVGDRNLAYIDMHTIKVPPKKDAVGKVLSFCGFICLSHLIVLFDIYLDTEE